MRAKNSNNTVRTVATDHSVTGIEVAEGNHWEDLWLRLLFTYQELRRCVLKLTATLHWSLTVFGVFWSHRVAVQRFLEAEKPSVCDGVRLSLGELLVCSL